MCLHVKHFLHEPFLQLGKTYVEKGKTGKHEFVDTLCFSYRFRAEKIIYQGIYGVGKPFCY